MTDLILSIAVSSLFHTKKSKQKPNFETDWVKGFFKILLTMGCLGFTKPMLGTFSKLTFKDYILNS